MPIPSQDVLQAKYKYREVEYSPFGHVAGSKKVLIADPWAYLDSYLKGEIEGTRGDNKSRLDKAIYYVDLAESFSKASETISLPAKGTLVYYSMLNLVKAFLSVKGVNLEADIEHHGLMTPGNFKVKVMNNRSGIDIFAKFCEVLGKPVEGSESLDIADCCLNIPELHEIAYQVSGQTSKQSFLPVKVQLLVNEAKNKLFTEISYAKRNEERVAIEKFYRGPIKDYFKESYTLKDHVKFRSKNKKNLTRENFITLHRNICKEYSKFNLNSLLTRNGYSYYYNLTPNKFHHLSNLLMVMFYIGTVARYRPTEMKDIMSGQRRSLISEAVAICPKQFLYHITSHITNNVCVIPFSHLG